jgi:hypothetical protein
MVSKLGIVTGLCLIIALAITMLKINKDTYESPKIANLCDDTVLYPPNDLKVKYGLKDIPDNHRCTQFIQPP